MTLIEVKKAAMRDGAIDTEAVAAGAAKIREYYFSTPLSAMKRDVAPYSEVAFRAAELIEKLELTLPVGCDDCFEAAKKAFTANIFEPKKSK